VKITKRLAVWAETSAEIWAAYWLLIVGSTLVFASAVLKWVNFPLHRHPLGLQLPLLRNVELIPHFSLLSYGIVGIAVLTTGLILLWRSDTYLALTAAAILIALWMAAPCQIAFQQPAFLGRLIGETQELPMIRGFTKTYLPTNYGPAEEYSKHFEFDTVWGRFVAAYSFLGLGWYCFGIGSSLIAIYLIARLPAEQRMRSLALSGIPAGVVIILLTPSLIGQHYFISACTAQARGAREKAITYYRRAMWFDRWRAQDINIYAAIGDLERLSGLSNDSPERHISKAREFKEASEYELAVFELARAADWGGAVATAARHESARTRVDFGTALYRGGGIGAAVTQWQQAVIEEPVQQQGITFLIARGNYDLGRYQASLDVVKGVLRASADRPIRANAYSLAGDCYAKLGRDFEARNFYNRSLKEDMYLNFWGMSRLTGN
jgi:tetratricopeptide (TPR) repeat protein